MRETRNNGGALALVCGIIFFFVACFFFMIAGELNESSATIILVTSCVLGYGVIIGHLVANATRLYKEEDDDEDDFDDDEDDFDDDEEPEVLYEEDILNDPDFSFFRNIRIIRRK